MSYSLLGTPHEAFKILGPISIAIAVVAAWLLLRMWPRGRGASISGHAGAQRKTYWLFLSVLIGDGALFFLFMWLWFIPTMQLPLGFFILLIADYALQIATAVIPDRSDGSRTSKAHALVAFSMAVAMMFLVGWLAVAPHVATPARVLSGCTFTLMGVFWYLFLFVKSTRRHFLVYQSAYIMSAYLCILVATYIR